MFKESSIFVYMGEGVDNPVKTMSVDESTRSTVCELFSQSANKLIECSEVIKFEGNYKPDQGEILSIHNFNLPESVKEAICNPFSLPSFNPRDHEDDFNMKALFVVSRQKRISDDCAIAFQRIRKEQRLSKKKLKVFFDNNTIMMDNRWGMSILEVIDCIFFQNELRFTSYHYARQVLDLSQYYRLATDEDVQRFCQSGLLKLLDEESFKTNTDSWVRRKIASVNDSRILEKFSAKEIQKRAIESNLNFIVEDEKVVVPDDKKQLKIMLGFLDEGIFKGIFTEETFITNSKRKLK